MTGFKTVAAMVKAMIEELNITVPVALHLDHGTYEGCYKCIEAGFSSVMFDGSHFPIEENIAKTSELVKVCHEKKGLSIEAEVGSIGGEEDGVIGAGEIADPNECKKIADLGVDLLAAGIGNIHGKYPANWKGLDFDALAKTKELIGDLPLVLHGGTGIPDDMIQKRQFHLVLQKSMLIQSVSYTSKRLQESILKKAKTLKVKVLTQENFLLQVLRLLKLLLKKRWNFSVQSTKHNFSNEQTPLIILFDKGCIFMIKN